MYSIGLQSPFHPLLNQYWSLNECRDAKKTYEFIRLHQPPAQIQDIKTITTFLHSYGDKNIRKRWKEIQASLKRTQFLAGFDEQWSPVLSYTPVFWSIGVRTCVVCCDPELNRSEKCFLKKSDKLKWQDPEVESQPWGVMEEFLTTTTHVDFPGVYKTIHSSLFYITEDLKKKKIPLKYRSEALPSEWVAQLQEQAPLWTPEFETVFLKTQGVVDYGIKTRVKSKPKKLKSTSKRKQK